MSHARTLTCFAFIPTDFRGREETARNLDDVIMKTKIEPYRFMGRFQGNLRDINSPYYMASSVRGQDESNPALRLATRAGKMELSCPLGTTCRVPQEKFSRKPLK